MKRNATLMKHLLILGLLFIGFIFIDIGKDSFGHVDPVEQGSHLSVFVHLHSFSPADSYDSLLRGDTGEMFIKINCMEQEGHKPGRDGHPGCNESASQSGNQRYPEQLDTYEDIMAGEERVLHKTSLGKMIYAHSQCHSLRSFKPNIEIWEEDDGGTLLAAFKVILGRVALGAIGITDEVAGVVISTVLSELGLQEALDALVKQLSEALGDVLEIPFGPLGKGVGEMAATLALGELVDEGMGAITEKLEMAGDDKLLQVAKSVREQPEFKSFVQFLRNENAIGKFSRSVVGNVADEVVDFVVDSIIGAGNDFVGGFTKEFQVSEADIDRALSTGRETVYTKTLESDIYDPTDKRIGATITLKIRTIHSPGDVPECNRPPTAIAAIERISEFERSHRGRQIKEATVKIGSEIPITSEFSTDPDLLHASSLTSMWDLKKPEGSKAVLTLTDDDPDTRRLQTRVALIPEYPGTYIVTLKVKDIFGAESLNVDSLAIHAVAHTPVPKFDIKPGTEVEVGTVVTLDGRASTDADLEAPNVSEKLSYDWTIHRPIPPGATIPPPPFAFRNSAPLVIFKPDMPGRHVVQLDIKDRFGLSSTLQKTLIVKEVPVPHFHQQETIEGVFSPIVPDKEFIDEVSKGRARVSKELEPPKCNQIGPLTVCEGGKESDVIEGVSFKLGSANEKHENLTSTGLPDWLAVDPQTGAIVAIEGKDVKLGKYVVQIEAWSISEIREIAVLWLELDIKSVIKISVTVDEKELESQEEDTDGDGTSDATDECPEDPGPSENAGCPDTPSDD